MPNYHFISYLSDSGSILLAAILRQNPIGEPLFEHDFKNVEYDAPEFDFQLEARGGTAFDPRWNSSQGVRLFPRFVREVLPAFFIRATLRRWYPGLRHYGQTARAGSFCA